MTRRPYDRTRWDRLQASCIVAAVVIVTGMPLWLALAWHVLTR
jgi:hypothetical protein